MDVSPEGRMAVRNLLKSTESGLGNGETAIFPIHIFRIKKGINFNPGEPNYDLFKLACRCSARRMFPNFAFQDAPFNLKYYDPSRVETEIAYMGCRTRVVANVADPDREITYQRGNLSFSSVNLPRCAILAKGDRAAFYKRLDEELELVKDQLLERLEVQARKRVYNFPFLMGQGLWLDSEKLKWDDEIRSVIKHGTLSIGFIGLAETLVSLTGSHHGQSAEAQKLGLEIVRHLRAFCDRQCQLTGLNFSLLATPAEGLSGRFLNLDKQRFGKLPGITDKEYYTNSFHVPVRFAISAFDKIRIEAPYHELTNAGHITYVEMDGDTTQNLEAFEKVIRFMAESGIGYGAINHPIDRDPVCGYNGIIGDTCPACGRSEEGGAVPFDRIRRITGYLVGTLDRFNNAKRAEEHDRIKHGLRD
jgi:ribonucleoside-triphosphate reductase